MCEPHHSIVQLNLEHFSNPQTASMLLGRAGEFSRQDRNFIHISCMGKGHSETIGHSGIQAHLLEQRTFQYEAAWWNRKFHFDNAYNYANDTPTEEELEAAKQYANRVSIGSLAKLRQFLEVSMVKTPRIDMYINSFRSLFNPILNKKGLEEFQKQVKKIPDCQRGLYSCMPTSKQGKQSIINLCLGFTRKRSLLVPEWADDNGLWNKNKEVIAHD